MSVERIIGIDFGTSTSVMRVKRYRENGQSVDDRLYTAEVKFGNSSLVPTLIREMQAGEPYYGYDAQKEHKKSILFDNFKVNLESSDPQERERARTLTEDFFTYLAKQYRDQSTGGFFGEADETERTIVSYPVKWSEETRRFMLDAAKKAGFKNVEGMDEAQAAITAVMVQSADYLSQRGYLHDGVPANILMADMGAGTTDLVLCRYTPGRSATYEILSAWPKDVGALFGGREVEGMLRDYLRGMLPEEKADIVMKRCGLGKFKSWKEDYVSPALGRKEAVTEFYEFDERIEDLDIEIEEYAIDRDEFEKMAAAYLKEFPMLVNGCLEDAGLSGDEVDLVLLTGGHSQWYFVREQLCGTLERFGAVGLGKIQADPERIIPVPRPQETVALGLVYSPLAKEVRFAGKEEAEITPELEAKSVRQEEVEAKPSRQTEVQAGVKPDAQPVHKGTARVNAESGVWDESMRVLPMTPEERFEFRRVEDGYEVADLLIVDDGEDISIPSVYNGLPVTSIGENAVADIRYDAGQIEIPGSCRVIKKSAFEDATFSNIIFHHGLEIIEDYAFVGIQSSSIKFPEGLLKIGKYAFAFSDFKEVHMPVSCRVIESGAFGCNKNLTRVIFPSNSQITEIDENAFWDTEVQEIRIPATCICNKLIKSSATTGEKGGLFKKAIQPRAEELITIKRY